MEIEIKVKYSVVTYLISHGVVVVMIGRGMMMLRNVQRKVQTLVPLKQAKRNIRSTTTRLTRQIRFSLS